MSSYETKFRAQWLKSSAHQMNPLTKQLPYGVKQQFYSRVWRNSRCPWSKSVMTISIYCMLFAIIFLLLLLNETSISILIQTGLACKNCFCSGGDTVVFSFDFFMVDVIELSCWKFLMKCKFNDSVFANRIYAFDRYREYQNGIMTGIRTNYGPYGQPICCL